MGRMLRDDIPDWAYQEAKEYSDGSFLNKHVYAIASAIVLTRHKKARLLKDYHIDYGPVVWWKFPVDEPSWIGTTDDEDWPGYHTHWTPHPEIPEW